MTTPPAPHLNPAEETLRFAGLTIRFLLTGEHANNTVATFEISVAGHQRLPAPAHSHDHYEETIYGLEGTLTWAVNGHPIQVAPGQALCIPRGAIHRFDNLSPQPAKALCIITPAAIGPEYFREIAAVFAATAPGTPPDKSQVLEIMRRHGLTPAPPQP